MIGEHHTRRRIRALPSFIVIRGISYLRFSILPPLLFPMVVLSALFGLHPGELHAAVTVNITYTDGANEGFNDPNLGTQRRTAFEAAVSQWASALSGNVPIQVSASFDPLGGTTFAAVLGAAGPNSFNSDFNGAPVPGTVFAAALANQFAGTDLNGSEPEIIAFFNSDVDGTTVLGSTKFYYGTDGNAGSDIDFYTVALHEMGHGLGFLSSFGDDGAFRINNLPHIYDHFLVNGPAVNATQLLTMTQSQRAAALVSNSLYFNGFITRLAGNNQNARIYAPSPYEPGSSVSHLDEATYSGINELMTPMSSGVTHQVGPIATGVFNDMGWNLSTTGSPPPTIDSVTPSQGTTGTTLDVVIAGTGFQSGAVVDFDDITVSQVTVDSSTQLTVNVTIPAGLSVGFRDVSVVNPDLAYAVLRNGFEVVTIPPPSVTSINPTEALRGTTLDVTITGTDFNDGATVNFGSDIAVNQVTFNSSTELVANITVNSTAIPGHRDVTVTNPDKQQSILTDGFLVTALPPTLSKVDPTSADRGATVDLTLTGTGLIQGATVSLGSGITVNSVQFRSETELGVNITIAVNTALGTRSIQVTNPDGQSATLTDAFTVTNPPPVVTGVSPAVAAQRDSLEVTIEGQNFVSGAAADFGTGITVTDTTFVSGTRLRAQISIANDAPLGMRTVTVTNPDTLSGSLTDAFQVIAPAPTITSVIPAAAPPNRVLTVTVAGGDFQDGATLDFGRDITVNSVQFVSASELKAELTLAPGGAMGKRRVTVTNPDNQTGSLADGFEVSTPVWQCTFPAGVNTVTFPSEFGPVDLRTRTLRDVFGDAFAGIALYNEGSFVVEENPDALASDLLPPDLPRLGAWARAAGEGFVLKLSQAAVRSLPGRVVDATTDFVSNPIPANSWHLFGNPWQEQAVRWSDVQYTVGSTSHPLSDLWADVLAGTPRPLEPYGWIIENGQRYLVADTSVATFLAGVSGVRTELQPCQALWIHTFDTGGDVRLTVPRGSQTSPATVATSQITRAFGPDAWVSDIVAEASGAVTARAFFGLADSQRASLQISPPPLVTDGPAVDVLFVNSTGRAVAGDVQSTTSAHADWEFVVQTAHVSGPVTLRWPSLNNNVPGRFRLTLVDLDTGRRWSMRTSTYYRFTVNDESPARRRFRIEMSPASEGRLRIGGLQVSGASRAAGAVTVSYSVNVDAEVTVRILTPTGRVVGILPVGTVAAGINRSVWNLRDTAGHTVPAGMYLVEIVASDQTGRAARSVRAFALR